MLYENSIRTTTLSTTYFGMTIVYYGGKDIAKMSTQSNEHGAQRI